MGYCGIIRVTQKISGGEPSEENRRTILKSISQPFVTVLAMRGKVSRGFLEYCIRITLDEDFVMSYPFTPKFFLTENVKSPKMYFTLIH